MPQQTIRVDDNGNPITNSPPSLAITPDAPIRERVPMTTKQEGDIANRVIKGGVKALPQIALAVLTRGLSVPRQMGVMGGAGAVRAKLEGEDPLVGGLAEAGMAGATSGVANMFKPVRTLQNAAGPAAKMTEQQALEILEEGAGRLVPSNSSAMRTAADKVRTTIPNLPRNAQGKIIPGPRSLPGPSPLDPAAAAHQAGAVNAARQSIGSAPSSVGAVARAVMSPTVRSAAAQGVYSLAGQNPSGLANAIRLALMSMLTEGGK